MRQRYQAVRSSRHLCRHQIQLIKCIQTADSFFHEFHFSKSIPKPFHIHAAGRIGMHHVQIRHHTTVTRHLPGWIQDNMIRHSHRAKRGSCAVREISRADRSCSHRAARQITASDIYRQILWKIELLRCGFRDSSHNASRSYDLRQLCLRDTDIFQHFFPILPRVDIPVNRTSQNGIVFCHFTRQEIRKIPVKLQDMRYIPEHSRLVFFEPQQFRTRPESIAAHLPCMILYGRAAKGIHDFFSFFQRPCITPQDRRSKRLLVCIKEHTGFTLYGDPQRDQLRLRYLCFLDRLCDHILK